MTYIELYKFCVEKLKSADIEDSDSDVKLLFYYFLNADRSFLFMNGDKEVSKESCDTIFEAINKRMEHIPLQHITGRQNFMGLEFMVDENVLIPRFDTETLVEEAMLVCHDGDKVLDVCTGSGCILISLMKYKNDLNGVGCDISDAALELARKNADSILCKPDMDGLYNSSDISNPRFIKSDLFESIEETDFDIIVSNPPYIKSDVINTLMPEVRDHDPMIALDGGKDGLDFYRIIVNKSLKYLRNGGWLLVEIGHDQGDDVANLFMENGYSDVKIVKDLAGLDRVVKGRTGR